MTTFNFDSERQGSLRGFQSGSLEGEGQAVDRTGGR